jgi:hypothetical protein
MDQTMCCSWYIQRLNIMVKNIGLYIVAAIIVLVALGALYAGGYLNGLSFFNALSIVPISTCSSITNIPGLTSLTNMSCANQVSGGVLTGLSSLQYSNVSGVGRATIADYVLNGAGQQILGQYTTGQVTQAINGSKPAINQTVIITGVQNYQRLKLPYTYSGQQLDEFYSQSVTGFNYGVSLGFQTTTQCSQTNQTSGANGNPSYTIGCGGYNAALDMNNYLNGYVTKCQSLNAKTFLVGVATIPGIGTAYQVDCRQAASTSLGAIYTAGSPSIAENLTIIYQNGSTQHTFTLTNTQPESSYNNQVIAQIYGYTPQGLTTFTGTTAPQVIVNQLGTKYIVNPQGTLSYTQIEAFSPTCYQYAGVAPESSIELTIYNPTTFNNCISNQTQLVQSFLKQQLQPANPYSTMTVSAGSGGTPYVGTVDVTKNPIYAPQIQIIAKAPVSLTGVINPVIQPSIVQPYPSPVFQSGSSATLTFQVKNAASYQGSAYIVVYLNGVPVGQSPDFNLPSGGPTPELVTISGQNSNLANINVQYTATVYAAQQTSINSSITFSGTIRPNCPSGSVYQNQTNCVSEGTGNQGKCAVGYATNATGGCSSICTSIGGNLTTKTYSNGTTVTSCTLGTPPASTGFQFTIGDLAIIAVIVVIIIAGALLSGKKQRTHKTHKRGGIR